MNRELDDQGARVRLKDDMLNLTDMWRAAGGDQQKQPAKWRDLPQATDFIAYIAQTLGKSENRLTLTKAGKTGGTWAHWQIGLAYAKYLSPAFHAWCNSRAEAVNAGGDIIDGEFDHFYSNQLPSDFKSVQLRRAQLTGPAEEDDSHPDEGDA